MSTTTQHVSQKLRGLLSAYNISVGRILTILVLLILWQLLSMALGPSVFPSPARTLSDLANSFQTGGMSGAITTTFYTVIVAYFLAAVLGISIGIIVGTNEFLMNSLEPIISSIYSVPKVVLYPLFLILLGLTTSTRIAFGTFHGIFPIIILTMNGMNSVDNIHLEVGRSFNISRLQNITKIIIPTILPFIATGLRLGFATTFIGVLLGEMFAGYAGLGHQLITAMGTADMSHIFSIVIIVAIIAVAGTSILHHIEGKLNHGSASEELAAR